MIRSGEIEKMLKSDSWDKKRASHGKYRSRGAVRTPVDLLTGQGKKDYQEKKYVNLSKIHDYNDFKKLTEKQKKKVLKRWMKIHTLDTIFSFSGWNPVNFFKQLQPFGFKMENFEQRKVDQVEKKQEQQTQVNNQPIEQDEIMSFENFKKMDAVARHEFLVEERSKYGNNRMNKHWGKNKISYYLHEKYTKKGLELPKINYNYITKKRMESSKNNSEIRNDLELKEQTQPMKEASKHEKTKISDWIHDVPVTALPSEPKTVVPIAADGFQTSYKKSSVHAADAAKRLRMLANLIEESGGLFQLSIDISEIEQKNEVLALGEPPAEEKEEPTITEQDLKLLKLFKELQGI